MRSWLSVCLVMLGSLTGVAANAQVEGTDYQVLDPAQPISHPDKIVVTEFFSYQCPHCYHFSFSIDPWEKTLPRDVVFERIPVSFGRPSWSSIGQAYYSLLAMGKLNPEMDAAIFRAIHVENVRLDDLSSMTDWLVKQGVNAGDFTNMYNSFGIRMDMDRAQQAVVAYGIEGVPTLIVDGKYRIIAPRNASNEMDMAKRELQVVDQLIVKERAARGMSAPHVIANVRVTNPISLKRSDESVIIPFGQMGLASTDPRAPYLLALENDKAVPQQLIDTDGDGKPDALLIMASYAAHQVRYFKVASDPQTKPPALPKRTQAEVSIKEGGRWDDHHYVGGHFVNVDHVELPPQYTDHSNYIRYEGPGIESDKVAYRVYLDQRNGFDIFGKKIHSMVLQNIGHDDQESYENDASWGLDIFKVGDSLGTGGFGYWNGKQVEPVAVTASRDATIVANGDLYSAFQIGYGQWQVNHGVYNMTAMISMEAGSRLAHVQVKMESTSKKHTMPAMAIGVVHHPHTKLLLSNSHSKLEWAYAASWGKQSRIGPDEYLGVGVLFHRAKRLKQTEDANSYVSVMNADDGKLDYYFFAAWDKEPGGIKTERQFRAFLDDEVKRLSSPLQVMSARPHNVKIH